METKISPLGIVRNTTGLNTPFGGMQDMINLRKKYGSWRPIFPKTVVKSNYAASNELYIHSMDEFEYFISYNTDGSIKALTEQGAEVETLITIAVGHDIKINSLGAFLVISDLDTFDKYVFRCSPDQMPKYKNISNIPFLNLSISSTVTGTHQSKTVEMTKDAFLAGWWTLEEDMRANNPEYFEGYVFIKWAVELIDGTMLKHSLPVFIYCGDSSTSYSAGPPEEITITHYLSQIAYEIQSVLPGDWEDYESLIRGISVFMSRPVSKYDLDNSGVDNLGGYAGLIEKPALLVDLFRNESAYYRIHHIPFNKITGGGTGVIGTSKPITSAAGGTRRGGQTIDPTQGRRGTIASTSSSGRDRPSTGTGGPGAVVTIRPYNPAEFNVNDIMSYEMLNVDDVSHHNIIGLRSLNYNSRLFMGDIYTRLFDGFNIADLVVLSGSTVTEFDIYLEVDLQTDLGLRTVRQTMKSTKDSIIIPTIIGYPDFRATEMRILHNSGGTLKKLTIALESHPVLNISYGNKLDGVDIADQAKDSDGFTTILISAITTAATLADLNTSLRDKNRVQLTEMYNPFITPAINSYQVGEGNIIALAVNMIPMDDQFGSYPVFVFTSRGIWALNLSDNGSVVVANIAPVSSSVCTNADSVIVVDNLLVFLASDGIKLLTGQTPAEISDIAEGPILSPLASDVTYQTIKGLDLLNDMSARYSSVQLLEYAAGSKFAFDKTLREIIVSNYAYEYSYAYSLIDKMWYKCSQRFKKFINNYPNVYALSTGNDLVNISSEQETGDIPVYFETKPMPIGPEKEIKVTKMVLDGFLNIADSHYGALYVFGSNDLGLWSLITGKEITGSGIYNIIIPRLPISLRHLILVFSGTVNSGSHIKEISLSI